MSFYRISVKSSWKKCQSYLVLPWIQYEYNRNIYTCVYVFYKHLILDRCEPQLGLTRAVLTTSLTPGQISELGPISMQPLTGIKLQMSLRLNIYLLYWYFQQNQCLNIKNISHTTYFYFKHISLSSNYIDDGSDTSYEHI
jgi:hypothetical protein